MFYGTLMPFALSKSQSPSATSDPPPAPPGMIQDSRAGTVGYQTPAVSAGPGAMSIGSIPTFGNMQAKKTGFTPEAAANAARQSSNVINQYMAGKQQQGLNVLQRGTRRIRDLYKDSVTQTDTIGQQAYDRINQDLAHTQAQNNSNLISRGLGNSSILATVNQGAYRNAEDARRGVDEQRAAQQIALNQGLSQQESALSGAKANYLMSYVPQDAGAQAATGLVGYKKEGGGLGGILGSLAGGIVGSMGGGIGSAIGSKIGGLFG